MHAQLARARRDNTRDGMSTECSRCLQLSHNRHRPAPLCCQPTSATRMFRPLPPPSPPCPPPPAPAAAQVGGRNALACLSAWRRPRDTRLPHLVPWTLTLAPSTPTRISVARTLASPALVSCHHAMTQQGVCQGYPRPQKWAHLSSPGPCGVTHFWHLTGCAAEDAQGMLKPSSGCVAATLVVCSLALAVHSTLQQISD